MLKKVLSANFAKERKGTLDVAQDSTAGTPNSSTFKPPLPDVAEHGQLRLGQLSSLAKIVNRIRKKSKPK